ncbi:hypothetical protein A6J33_000245 [Pantoea sp. FDAARGOS_194]|uniref:hypothetical protein n=1 Tax=Enterobacterales TaxID=91347 RepID=UPI000BB5652E|nr:MULTISPECIES: hypothetical protein [Enterobacterales]MDU6441042.1 hypothetical protein [Pantoea sp.]MCB3570159.1 hypothetical protein [Klebsiella michiganensis]MDH2069894.1 hypothetical protein [Pantoea sp. GD03673]MEB5708189.1 hypothetical protein [Pantoea anthophila]MEB6519103.1 hypothetical protein [Pantoea anthophila]
METAQIYVTGSGDPQTRLGFARVLIEQGSRKSPFIFNYEGTTYKRSQIQGMIDAVLQLDCPHHVVFISASPLALEKAEIGEGPNRDLIYELYRVLATKGCTYVFDFRVGKGKEINKLLLAHSV